MRELGSVAVDERAIVSGEIFSCCLVFGKVPTGGEFGLQSLVTKQEIQSAFCLIMNIFSVCPVNQDTLFYRILQPTQNFITQFEFLLSLKPTNVRKVHNNTYPNFSEEITNNVEGGDSSRRCEG